MNFSVGSLVRARGREWVVLPSQDEEMLVVRPLGGTDDEITGIYLPLEPIESAQFALPDPERSGDYRSGSLLREAVRLGFRSSVGPFRSFAHIAVEPRPYQLVPLLMALKLDPVRLLIADDVGIGKTIEAGLIARELLDRGEIERMAVLCPPQLAEQWQAELLDKFHIQAQLVLSSTATQLERQLLQDQTIFDRFPFVVVSTDFMKADSRRNIFLQKCPELVIVDEAHTCAYGGEGRGTRHQRYQLVSSLAADKNRHLILVTATPHSGNEEAFRSLLGFLDEDFKSLPQDLTGEQNAPYRQRLAAHFVQRRREDIRSYLDANTPFPKRLDKKPEPTYTLSKEYAQFFGDVIRYARKTVNDQTGGATHQRVRYWSALALLRSIASSPAAAVATLQTRARNVGALTPEEADRVGRLSVLDLMESDAIEGIDQVPGSDFTDEQDTEEIRRAKRELKRLASEAEKLKGAKDEKLLTAQRLIGELVKERINPIIFCYFIPTAHYVAEALRKVLPKDVEVVTITGELPPAEREDRIERIEKEKQRVLVCTDCLSEGINLQKSFDAVFHYDLSWNPTRHEQREGRVDRYGQPEKEVRVVTYYGIDNQIDGLVLDVLIRKHRSIRSSLGISVPVPMESEKVLEAVFEGLLFRENIGSKGVQLTLPLFDELQTTVQPLFEQWEANAEREKHSRRTLFAQQSIKVEEVASELAAVRHAIGSNIEVEAFTREALTAYGAFLSQAKGGALQIDLLERETPRSLRDALMLQRFGLGTRFKARFELPVQEKEVYLSRTHPIIEGLATYVMDSTLDPQETAYEKHIARRSGVISTSRVARRTTVLLIRMRFHIVGSRFTHQGTKEFPMLAEDCQVLAFTGAPRNAEWITDNESIEQLLLAAPEANISPDRAKYFLRSILDDFALLQPHLAQVAKARGEELLAAHRRVRNVVRARGGTGRALPPRVKEQEPDVLGIYVYLPKVQ
jgi:superfamily II DNA or RNA helicase